MKYKLSRSIGEYDGLLSADIVARLSRPELPTADEVVTDPHRSSIQFRKIFYGTLLQVIPFYGTNGHRTNGSGFPGYGDRVNYRR